MGKAQNSKRSGEGFIQWNGRGGSRSAAESGRDATSMSAGTLSRSAAWNTSSTGTLRLSHETNSEDGPTTTTNYHTSGGSQRQLGRQPELYRGSAPPHVDMIGTRRQEDTFEKSNTVGASTSTVSKSLCTDGTSKSRSSMAIRYLHPQNCNGQQQCHSSGSQRLLSAVQDDPQMFTSMGGRNLRNIHASLPWTDRSRDIVHHEWNNGRTGNMDDNVQDGSSKEGASCRSKNSASFQQRMSPEEDIFSFENASGDDDVMGDSDEECQTPVEAEEAVLEDIEEESPIYKDDIQEESLKRRDRRQAQAKRFKEGERRWKEGLPRNFLMVDKYTKKPYGPGLGDWRKELMLLSKNLDPAVMNINQQPESAVEEIADWIQHTWEYSKPIKFQFVKEVIARGVTLRRTEIWKKIRNNEPKPDGISDRTWCTLERLLQSEPMIKKSQNCSKANASRQNFGRTGPSGEVGVRQRLKKSLMRSPEPEEIRNKMNRDKGYGGRFRRKPTMDNVMHGNCGKAGLLKRSENTEPSLYASNNVGRHCDVGNARKIAREDVLTLSQEQITEHPLVQHMMQRLQALEGRPSAPIIIGGGPGTKHANMPHLENAVAMTVERSAEEDEQGDVEGQQLGRLQVRSTSGKRPRRQL